jgi:hypothetical protein
MVTHTTILSAIISFGLLAMPTVAAPAVAAAAAGERLGGIDMNRACKEQYFNLNVGAVRTGNTCNDWKCEGTFAGFPISLNVDTPAACAKQYGTYTYAWCEGGWDKWSCYRS